MMERQKILKMPPVKNAPFPTPGYTATPSTTSKSGVGEWGMGHEDSTYCHGVLDAECQAPQAVPLIPQPPLAFSDEENSFKPYHLLTLQAQLPHESTHGVRRDRSTHSTCGLWAANKQFITPETS